MDNENYFTSSSPSPSSPPLMVDTIPPKFYSGDYDDDDIYCPQAYQDFWLEVEPSVLNVNLVLCSFGLFVNFLNLVVFTRKSMLSSTNAILAGISVADFVAMAGFIPEYVATLERTRREHPYPTAVIWIIHEFLISVFHPVSTWLTTTLAIWRYIAVLHPLRSKVLCTMRRAKGLIVTIFIVCFVICLPNYLPGISVQIVASNETLCWKLGGCGAAYCSHWTSYSVTRIIELWWQGFVSKVVPAAVLTFVSIRLIMTLVQASRKRKKMRYAGSKNFNNNSSSKSTSKFRPLPSPSPSPSPPPVPATSANQWNDNNSNSSSCVVRISVRREYSGGSNDDKLMEMASDSDRITKMLLAILLIFLVTEIPPGVMYVLETLFGASFYFECRRPMHFFNFCMYFLSGVMNFAVYVIMSRKFRNTLKTIFSNFVKS